MSQSPVYSHAWTLPFTAALVMFAACDPAAETGTVDGREPADRTYATEAIEQPPASEVPAVGGMNPDVGARTAMASTATANLKPVSDSGAGGTLAFAQSEGYVRITGEITGLAP